MKSDHEGSAVRLLADGEATIRNSVIRGEDSALGIELVGNGSADIANTQIQGGAGGSELRCFGTFTETYAPVTCP